MRKEDLRRLQAAHLALSEAYGQALENFEPADKRMSVKSAEPARIEDGRKFHPQAEPDTELNKTDRKILTALAQIGRSARIETVGIVGDFAHGAGPVGTSLAKLRREGYITGSKNELQITFQGRGALGDFMPMPQGYQLFEFWRNKLPSPCGKILVALRQNQADALSIERIGDLQDFAHAAGPVGTALALLRRMGFVEGKKDALRLTEDFRKQIDPSIRVFDRQSGETVLVNARGHAK